MNQKWKKNAINYSGVHLKNFQKKVKFSLQKKAVVFCEICTLFWDFHPLCIVLEREQKGYFCVYLPSFGLSFSQQSFAGGHLSFTFDDPSSLIVL